MSFQRFLIVSLVVIFVASAAVAGEIQTNAPQVKLTNAESKDQDDMCVWVHPLQRAQSTIVASDKSAGRVFVYDLSGQLLQSITLPKPGNIDIRQNVTLDDKSVVVVVNEAPHQYVGEFGIEGASQTDGIELCTANLGDVFPEGIFCCHTDRSPRWVLITSWNAIKKNLNRE